MDVSPIYNRDYVSHLKIIYLITHQIPISCKIVVALILETDTETLWETISLHTYEALKLYSHCIPKTAQWTTQARSTHQMVISSPAQM